MHANRYSIIMNSFEGFCAVLRYPTINILKIAVKMQISGLFASGIFGSFIYRYITNGKVMSMAMNPVMKNKNPISVMSWTFDVIAPIVIPTNTIQ